MSETERSTVEAVPIGKRVLVPFATPPASRCMIWPGKNTDSKQPHASRGSPDILVSPSHEDAPVFVSPHGSAHGSAHGTPTLIGRAESSSSKGSMDGVSQIASAAMLARRAMRRSPIPRSPTSRNASQSPSFRLGKPGSSNSLLKELDAEIQDAERLPEAGLLSVAEAGVLREVGRVPIESRLWGADDAVSERSAVDILSRLPDFSRFDLHTLRLFCHAGQWKQFRKSQVISTQGDKQDVFFIILTGVVGGRLKSKKNGKSSIMTEKDSSSKETGPSRSPARKVVSRTLSGTSEAHGDEIARLFSGEGVGMSAMLVTWDLWPVTYLAQTKAEVLAIPRSALEMVERPLRWSFDTRTLINVLREYAKMTREKKKVDVGQPQSADEGAARPDDWLTKISEAMAAVPYFRQFGSEVVHNLSRSAELVELELRQVVWEQTMGLGQERQEGTDFSDNAAADQAGKLHVVLQGKVWVFKKDVTSVLSLKSTARGAKLQDIWCDPASMFEAYGRCVRTLVEGDGLGGPTPGLAHECTMIAEPGTMLVRISHVKHARDIKSCSMVHEQGTIRRLLAMPDSERSPADREHLTTIIAKDVSFFQHMSRSHAAKLLEEATFLKIQKGGLLLKQGEEAQHLYIVLNGWATSYQAKGLAACDNLGKIWNRWELLRSKGGLEELGAVVGHCGFGRCVGETEVVEKTPFRTSVVADDEMEVICIGADDYTTVMWDLCDGEALDVGKIRYILSATASERTKDSTDHLVEMLQDSDFLSQFPQDVRRQMSGGMRVLDYAEGHVICEQDSIGDELFLIVSGSVALHKSQDGPAAADKHSHRARSAPSKALKLGPCTRVLGIGDSFGELAFVQARRHPTSAITRSRSTVIAIRRADMEAEAVDRMVSFVANPRSNAMDEVFAKDTADRNEKDMLLLINYLEMNPLLKQLSYSTMLDCAHSILRHNVPAAQPLRPGLGDGLADRITETRVYLVNSGSMQVTPAVKAPIAVHLHQLSQPPQTFGEQLQQHRRGGHSRNATVLFSGYLFLSKVEAQNKKDQSDDSLETSTPQRHVFAVDLSGAITFTGQSAKATSALSELGHVGEIASLERTSFPGRRFAIKLGLRGEHWILASNFRAECDSFVKALCDLNPFFAINFRSSVWVQEQIQLQRGDAEWRNIMLRINADGEMLYSSNLDAKESDSWLSIGALQNCSSCAAFPTVKKPWAIKLVLQSNYKEDQETSWVFSTGTQAEQHRWLDRFCMKVQPSVLNARFAEDEDFLNEHSDNASEVMSKTVGALMAKTIAHRRRRRLEAKQRLERASISSSSKGARKGSLNQDSTVTYSDGSVFVGYGSAFCTNGTAIANDEGCVLFSLSLSTWDRIKRRQIELHCEDAMKVLRNVPSLANAAQKDIHQLALHSFVSNWPVGEAAPCALLSSKHMHIILNGACKLRRVQEKQRHIDKVRNQALKSTGGTLPGLFKLDCPKCHGSGLAGAAVPNFSERINLCKPCKGQGSVVQNPDAQQHEPQVAELRASAVLSDSVARSDSLHNYEMLPSTSLQLLSAKAELWTELKLKCERLGPCVPASLSDSHAGLTEQLLENARAIRLAVKEGPVEQVLPKQLRFVKSLSIEEKAQRLIGKVHSARMREIDRLLSTHRQVQGEVYVDSKNQARSSVCSLAPPKTIVNRFAGLVPPLNLTPVFGDDVRGVFLTHLPAAERPSAAATERLLGSTVRKSKLLRAIQPNNAFKSHSSGGLEPLAGLSSTAVGANRTVAAPATTRSATDTLAHPWHLTDYAPRVALKYGNAFALDHRQKQIYRTIGELLSEANYSDFSSHASTGVVKKLSQGASLDPNSATVDMFEFYGALSKYRVMEEKVSNQRVQSLKAVSKKDATSIFKKCAKNDEGKTVPRLTQAMFHEAVKLVAGLLQTPLNGQPTGKPMRQRTTAAAKDARRIQNANTLTLSEEDIFASPVRAKHDLQARYMDIEHAGEVGLASISRNPATLPTSGCLNVITDG